MSDMSELGVPDPAPEPAPEEVVPANVLEVPLWLPKPRFAVGDAVQVDQLFAVVDDILMRGRWVYLGREGRPQVELVYYCYRLVAQRGSVVNGMATRPGVICDFDGSMVDQVGQLYELQEAPVGPDSAENIEDRHADWLAQYDGYPPGGPPISSVQ